MEKRVLEDLTRELKDKMKYPNLKVEEMMNQFCFKLEAFIFWNFTDRYPNLSTRSRRSC